VPRETLAYRLIETPLGPMALVSRGRRLVGVVLPASDRRRLAGEVLRRWPGARRSHGIMPRLTRQVADYFAGRAAKLTAPLDLAGLTDFQRRVLRSCRSIPAGGAATYGQLARRAGQPRAARAVGQALAANPVPLVIPCHRVIAAGGALGGFSAAGGARLKAKLLDHERRFFAPPKGRP
jgi:methylated-DNA-[protein]-cysteine S-methyltransferase